MRFEVLSASPVLGTNVNVGLAKIDMVGARLCRSVQIGTVSLRIIQLLIASNPRPAGVRRAQQTEKDRYFANSLFEPSSSAVFLQNKLEIAP